MCIVYISQTGQESPNGPIRLFDGGNVDPTLTSGRVQLRYNNNNQWGHICDDGNFGITEATVICHQLGYTGASGHSRTINDM